MLCNSKTPNRPDKLLQKSLISLSYALVALTISLLLFLFYPQYFIYLTALSVGMTALCLAMALKTLSTAEQAISYGGFANEIIRNDSAAKRIDNSQQEPILQNDIAKELCKNIPVLSFLESNLSDNNANKTAFYRLENACNNLSQEKVEISLSLNKSDSKIFGNVEWFEVDVHPIFLKKTDIFEGPFSIKTIKKDTYLYWNIKNITAKKNMERMFKQERKSLNDFLDYLPVGLYVTDKDYNIEYTNDSFTKALGYSHDDLAHRNLSEFIATNSDVPTHKNSLWQGAVHFTNSKHKVFETFVFQESFRENEEIKTRGVVIQHLPSEPELKANLNDAFDKISWLFNFAPVGILFVDKEGRIKDCNPRATDFIGQKRDKLLGSMFLDYVKEDDVPSFQKEFQNVSQNQHLSASLDLHINHNKEDKIALAYLSPMKKFYVADMSEINGMIVYLIDATKQKNLELQFSQAQKMQAVGQLAGGVAHDFNNLLTAMIGFCDLLLQRHGVGDPSFSDLIQIKQNANRAAGLVRQLLAFSRKQPLKPKLIDTTENFTELSHMLKRILGEQIVLKFHHGNDLGFIRVDPVQFSQVIINLAVNGKDAMEGHGVLSITTRVEHLSESYSFGDDIIKPGEFVAIDVTDTGCGIPPENMSRIFDPFFSTKQNVVGSGTGLGLAMVYGIVRQTEGFIKVDSVLGSGTTFSIYLPRFDSNTEEEGIKDNTKEVVTNKDGRAILTVQEKVKSPISLNEKLIFGLNLSKIDRSMEASSKNAEDTRIIFVEDEDSVRTFAIRALKKKGYEVIGCNSGENALQYLENDNKFDLLITDMMMPGISGAKLTQIVKEQIPEIKVILASGYSEEIVRQELSNFEEFEFITKPFSLGDLTKKVFDVLNG